MFVCSITRAIRYCSIQILCYSHLSAPMTRELNGQTDIISFLIFCNNNIRNHHWHRYHRHLYCYHWHYRAKGNDWTKETWNDSLKNFSVSSSFLEKANCTHYRSVLSVKMLFFISCHRTVPALLLNDVIFSLPFSILLLYRTECLLRCLFYSHSMRFCVLSVFSLLFSFFFFYISFILSLSMSPLCCCLFPAHIKISQMLI